MVYEWMGKTISKKNDQRIFWKNKINVKMQYVNKKLLARNGN